jgi:hypothetical protein
MGFSFQVMMSLQRCHCERAHFASEAISVQSVYACQKGVATPPEEHRRLAMTSFGGFNQNVS